MTTTTQSKEKAAPAVQLPVDLRDYFAAKAMQGFAADPSMDEVCLGDIADLSYEMADAMLRAREAK